MSMTPINRIPQDGENTIAQMVFAELNAKQFPTENGDAIFQLGDHTGNQNAISITLDWAMQIRSELGISWGECIDAAMTLYFG